MSKLIISLSPHAHGGDSVERNMYNVLIALVPALLVSFYYFGLGSVVVCSVSVAACVFFEWAITRYMLRRPTTLLDGSACITGLLLGMNLPSNFPIWMIIVGALVAIGIGKMTFGGLGCNPFNPAIVGRCFLLVSFPAAMTSWPVAGQQMAYTDAVTGATPLSLMKTAIKTGDVSVLAPRHHLAYPRYHSGHRLRAERGVTCGQSGLRPSYGSGAEWRSDAGCHLYGYRLRHLAHDPSRAGHLCRGHRCAHRGDTQLGQLSRGYVVCHTHHECLYAPHQLLCQT